MNWISNLDKKFIVPILLGISLTTVSCVSMSMLLYSMFGKDDETKDDSDKKSQQIITSRCIKAHYKVPKELLSAIIGIGGSVRRDIENKTGTHIRLDKKDVESPDYICIIQGNEIEGIRLAESMIKNILDSQPIIETYELMESYKVCKKSGILNKNEDIIQQIQRSSGAKIIMDYAAHNIKGRWKSKIIIKGTLNQIGCAVAQLEDKIYEVRVQAQLKHERAPNTRMLTSSANKNIENEIEDKIYEEIYDEIKEETYDEIFGETDDEIDDVDSLEEIISSSIPYKEWEEFIEKSGKTIEQIKKDFGVVEIVIEEDPISPNNNKVVIKGYFVPVNKALMRIRDKIRVLEKEKAQNSNIEDITDNLKERHRLSFIYKPSVPYKVWEKFIEKSGKTIEQIKQDFGDVEIIIEEDPISPDNNKVTLQGYLTPVTEAMKQIRDKVKSLDKKKKPPSNDSINMFDDPSDTLMQLAITNLTGEKREIEVFVSAVKTPDKFWIHIIGPGNAVLNNLVSEMTEYYNKAENRELHRKKVKLYKIVAAKFNHDNKWYRAEVLNIENSQCKVFYVDYGDVETIPINDVLELRSDMLCCLQLQAMECSLADTKPRGNEWTPKACDKFADLTHVAQWKPLIAKIKEYEYPTLSESDTESHYFSSPVFYIELYEKNDDKNIDIRETLIRFKLAKFEE